MQTIPTVKVVSPVSDDNPTGYVVINDEDFDEAVHKLFDDSEPVSPSLKLSVAELKSALDAAGIAYPAGAKKGELVELLDASVKE